jgi:hypothetical protein
MNYAKPLFIAVALASLTLTACTSATGEVEGPVGTVQQDSLTFNSLTFNSLTFNSLTFNSLTFNSLTFNSLTFNGLDSANREALTNANSRQVFQDIVNCALPAGEVIDVTNSTGSYSFSGGLGLAPEWGEPGGFCGPLCKEWVSACVISRIDFKGEQVEISLRGDSPALQTSAAERATYTAREATYYGDIFSPQLNLYACLSPGQTEDTRVCGPTIKGCGVNVLGSCADLCGPPRPDGSFPDCVGPRAVDGLPWFGGDDIYPGSITVFLQP